MSMHGSRRHDSELVPPFVIQAIWQLLLQMLHRLGRESGIRGEDGIKKPQELNIEPEKRRKRNLVRRLHGQNGE